MLPHADSEDSDQTGRMPRLIRVFAVCTGHSVGFAVQRFINTAPLKDPLGGVSSVAFTTAAHEQTQ